MPLLARLLDLAAYSHGEQPSLETCRLCIRICQAANADLDNARSFPRRFAVDFADLPRVEVQLLARLLDLAVCSYGEEPTRLLLPARLFLVST